MVLFASHSLLKDPPFSRIDLISCRNLLIYLDRDLQQQACSTFHYALNPDGFLFLGSSETADNPPGLFRSVDRKSRIYQSTANPGDKPRLLPRLLGSMGAARASPCSRSAQPVPALAERSRRASAGDRETRAAQHPGRSRRIGSCTCPKMPAAISSLPVVR